MWTWLSWTRQNDVAIDGGGPPPLPDSNGGTVWPGRYRHTLLGALLRIIVEEVASFQQELERRTSDRDR